jgi:methylmalonyl-CoA/ethylmalonyl-CoA epimerase
MQFDHVGLIVRDLVLGRRRLAAILPIVQWTAEFHDPGNGVRVQFGQCATPPIYELVAPLDADSPVSKTLAKGGNILNHLAYLVPDIRTASERLRRGGSAEIGPPRPAVAYGGRRIQFFMTPLRFIIEIVEAPEHLHHFERCS